MIDRLISLKNSVNLRELGDYPAAGGQVIAPHKLLRSGSLSELTPQEADWLRAYGLKVVVDLRSESEVAMTPDVLAAGVEYHHLSVYPFTNDSLVAKISRHLRAKFDHRINPMAEVYLKMLTDPHANDVYRALFTLLLATDQPGQSVLFHCAAGKDRTGVGAMMIEGALGVPEATIREDYLLTNAVFFAPSEEVKAALKTGASDLVDRMNQNAAETGCYVAVKDLIDKEYGDWTHYFTAQLGFSQGDLRQLRRLYLTDPEN
ncbi:tyrosine-protein phosphatase [Lacticaseibacillus jixianensis]|uniref:Tyrosine-protein phosphatase n=1 Tax=Lacticaseibacillus jixianensis TaxID=2486012 RepID=A0ABW4BBQ3_9LACO|nr:tyrosine-protein phosphatase [Lacticaseibacillus jixianensis]